MSQFGKVVFAFVLLAVIGVGGMVAFNIKPLDGYGPFNKKQQAANSLTRSNGSNGLPDTSGVVDIPKEQPKVKFSGDVDITRVGDRKTIGEYESSLIADSPRKLTKAEVKEMEEKLPDPKRYVEVSYPKQVGVPQRPLFKDHSPTLAFDTSSFRMQDVRRAKIDALASYPKYPNGSGKVSFYMAYDDTTNRWLVTALEVSNGK